MSRDTTAKTILNNPDPDPDRTVTNAPPPMEAKSHALPKRPSIPDVDLEQEIGRGGMGVVYSGRQTYLDRKVAVKLLLVDKADEEYVKRFQREAKILAGLSHQHIVSCYSAGVTPDHHPYLVMEFIDGPNLKDWVHDHGPINEQQALRIIHELALALNHAHEHSIIHRDVKPENVLLAKKENNKDEDQFPFSAKLVDLGLARPPRSQSEMNLTVEGMVMGTPTTMAPEQFEDPDGVDFKADMYGLGCVLYYALTGSPAFTGRTIPQLVSAKMNGPIPNPKMINKQLSSHICDLVMSLLAVKREQRPASYQELITTCGCPKAPATSASKRAMVIGGVFAAGLVVFIAFLLVTNRPESPPLKNNSSTESAVSIKQPVISTAATELGPPQPLFQPAVTSRLQGWDFASGAQWSASELHADGIAGIHGVISRAVPGDEWEMSATFAVTNNDLKTDSVRLGIMLPDESQVFAQVKNLTAALVLSVERSFADKNAPPEYIHHGSLPVAPVRIHFALKGQFLRMVINDIPLEKPIGLPAAPTKVFIDTAGKAPVEVSGMTIRLPDGLVLK